MVRFYKFAQVASGTALTILLFGTVNWTCIAQGTQNPNGDSTTELTSTHHSYQPAAESEQSKKGRLIFQKLNCSECHSVAGTGGCLAPPLDGVGERRSEDYLRLRLGKDNEDKFIHLIGHPELMPHPRFGEKTTENLVAYLETLPLPESGFKETSHGDKGQIKEAPFEGKEFVPQEFTADSREGRRLFLETGCMACHEIAQTGGFLGPKLDGIGARHSRRYIESHITNPNAHQVENGKGSSKMPQFDFTPDQVNQITSFLLTLPPSK